MLRGELMEAVVIWINDNIMIEPLNVVACYLCRTIPTDLHAAGIGAMTAGAICLGVIGMRRRSFVGKAKPQHLVDSRLHFQTYSRFSP
jgi:hypothetical protein